MKRTESPMFNDEQLKLIRDHLLKGAPEFEIQRFIITCERTGLDCFSRQIYGNVQRKKVKQGREEVWIPTVVIITSIDGFRAIGERSGQYRGQTKPEWHYVNDDGVSGWHDVFLTSRDRAGNPMKVPDACRVGVIREGFPDPCYGIANFDSFAQFFKEEGGGYVLSTFWKKMPEHMIAKVAEAQAFRKAFPLLACGLYVEEEVGRDEDDEPAAGFQPPEQEKLNWVAGHSPEERAAAKARPPAPPEEPKAPSTPPESQKPAGNPAEAPAAAKKTRGTKKEVAAPPADDAPGAEPPTAPPQEPVAPETKAAPWNDYVISQITIAKFNGKKISELSPADIESLETGWVQKYADKIKMNPAKMKEADMISAAHAFHQAAKK